MNKISRKGFLKIAAAAAMSGVTAGALAACNTASSSTAASSGAAGTYIPGTPAGPKDFDTEFLDYILAVKIVDSVEEAIAHIAAHSTGHSEAILTRTDAHAALFTAAVDSAAVYVNCSTRFTDGGEFGLGCEMGGYARKSVLRSKTV